MHAPCLSNRGTVGRRIFALASLLFLPLFATAQTLDIHDAVRTFATLSNTTVTMTGRAELRVTGTNDPLPGCVIHLNSPDAWLRLTVIPPSTANSTFLGRVRVNGANAVLDGNVRVVQYAQGAVIIPHTPEFAPLTTPRRLLKSRTILVRVRSRH